MPSLTEIRVKDPLSDVTRKERRNLLGACALGLLMAKTGLVPSRISALGIEFSPADQKTILHVVAVVIIYFIIAFMIYAVADLFAWGSAIKVAVNEHEMLQKRRYETFEGIQERQEIDNAVNQVLRNFFGRWFDLPYFFVRHVQWMRAIFEFLVPVLLGLYSIYCCFLWRH